MSQYKVLPFTSISSKVYSVWLEILCLIEGVRVDRAVLERLIDWNRGDLRKTLLQIQFWVLSGGDSVQTRSILSQDSINLNIAR